MAGVDDRSGRCADGRPPGEMLQAMFAFDTEAGAVRAGKFRHDLPSGTMAEDNSRQGRGKAEQEVEGDGR